MWSHDEGKEIPNIIAAFATIRCPKCGKAVKKYIESHYTGGAKCVLLGITCPFLFLISENPFRVLFGKGDK